MLHNGSSPDSDHQMTSPVTLSVDTERTQVADTPEAASPATAAPVLVLKGRPGSGLCKEEVHRRGRPGWVAREGEGEREEECGRERLKRHRVAMAGRVWIPETWGQEGLLKDWVDCAAVDRALVPSGLVSAREALVEECRRAEPGAGFLIESSCLSA